MYTNSPAFEVTFLSFLLGRAARTNMMTEPIHNQRDVSHPDAPTDRVKRHSNMFGMMFIILACLVHFDLSVD